MFYEQFIECCKRKNVSRTKACTDCGVSRTAWHKWENGAIPNGSTLNKFAEYFDVSVSYLLGAESENLVTNRDEVDRRIQERWAQLTEQEKQSFLAQIDAVLKLRGQ